MLPQGLACSPYFFYKVLRPVVQYLRENGLRLVLYVDDALLLGSSECIQAHKELMIDTLQSLGWRINWGKSVLVPSTCISYLGYIIDTAGKDCPVIKVKKERTKELRKSIV